MSNENSASFSNDQPDNVSETETNFAATLELDTVLDAEQQSGIAAATESDACQDDVTHRPFETPQSDESISQPIELLLDAPNSITNVSLNDDISGDAAMLSSNVLEASIPLHDIQIERTSAEDVQTAAATIDSESMTADLARHPTVSVVSDTTSADILSMVNNAYFVSSSDVVDSSRANHSSADDVVDDSGTPGGTQQQSLTRFDELLSTKLALSEEEINRFLDSEMFAADEAEEVGGGTDEQAGEQLAMLPPDHPLMARFQEALEKSLKRQLEEVDLDIANLEKSHKLLDTEQQECGEKLYDAQSRATQQRTALSQLSMRLETTTQKRVDLEANLEDARAEFEASQKQLQAQLDKEHALEGELSDLNKQLFYLKSLETEAGSQVTIKQKMAEKAKRELFQLQNDSEMQDFLIANISQEVDRLQRHISMQKDQMSTQLEENRTLQEYIVSAQMELDTLNMERKHIQNNWNDTLKLVQEKNNELNDIQGNISSLMDNMHKMNCEIHGCQKSIESAQIENEHLTVQFNNANIQKQKYESVIEKNQARIVDMQVEQQQYMAIIADTEAQLSACETECAQREREVDALRREIQACMDAKQNIDDQILAHMQEQMNSNNMSRALFNSIKDLKQKNRTMETKIAQSENEIAQISLKISSTSTQVDEMSSYLSQLKTEAQKAEQVMHDLEKEELRNNSLIQQKQCRLLELNKKLAVLITAAGGRELGPIELEISSMQKSVEQLRAECVDCQRLYLRLQDRLVATTSERDALAEEVEQQHKELIVLEQRKLRLEHSIENEQKSLVDTERQISNQRRVISRLNAQIFTESTRCSDLCSETTFYEKEVFEDVKAMEEECIQLQEQVEAARRETAALERELSTCGQRKVAWEAKLQLLQQARERIYGSNGYQREIEEMQAEIHRIKVNHDHLEKEQAHLLSEMESYVIRHETMAGQQEVAAAQALRSMRGGTGGERSSQGVTGTGCTQLSSVKRKLSTLKKDTKHLQSELERNQQLLAERSATIEEKQQCLSQLQADVEEQENLLTRFNLRRSHNLSLIVLLQHACKRYQQIVSGKYTESPASVSSLQLQISEVEEKHTQMKNLICTIVEQSPELEEDFSLLRSLFLV